MELGLFAADNILLKTLFFFMTYSVVYSIVVMLYEDNIIRDDHISIGLVAIAVKNVLAWSAELAMTFIYLPSCVAHWSGSAEGREDCVNFFGGLLLIAVGTSVVLGLLGMIFFGANYLLVDAGAGHYCKVWRLWG